MSGPHLCTDPRPYRRGGPFEDWQAATTRPSRVGQRVYTFGIPTRPSVSGVVLEVWEATADTIAIVLIQVDNSHRQVYVAVSHTAVHEERL